MKAGLGNGHRPRVQNAGEWIAALPGSSQQLAKAAVRGTPEGTHEIVQIL